jgi:hypothetical protein
MRKKYRDHIPYTVCTPTSPPAHVAGNPHLLGFAGRLWAPPSGHGKLVEWALVRDVVPEMPSRGRRTQPVTEKAGGQEARDTKWVSRHERGLAGTMGQVGRPRHARGGFAHPTSTLGSASRDQRRVDKRLHVHRLVARDKGVCRRHGAILRMGDGSGRVCCPVPLGVHRCILSRDLNRYRWVGQYKPRVNQGWIIWSCIDPRCRSQFEGGGRRPARPARTSSPNPDLTGPEPTWNREAVNPFFSTINNRPPSLNLPGCG